MSQTYSHEGSLCAAQRIEFDGSLDVEHAFRATRRPNDRLQVELVGLGVVVVDRALEGQSSMSLMKGKRPLSAIDGERISRLTVFSSPEK